MHDFLVHSGVKRKSGRYPWGSGITPYQHEWWFSWGEKEMGLREQGLTDQEIAKMMGLNLSDLIATRQAVKERERAAQKAEAYRLRQKGMSNTAIAERMGVTEGAVRNWCKENQDIREETIQNTVDILKKNVSAKKYLDVGIGNEAILGITETKKNAALAQLKAEGYEIIQIKVPQQNNTTQKTTMKILAPPGTTWKDVQQNQDRIAILNETTRDNGKTWLDIYPPENIKSDRVMIRYGDDGGKEKDGLIEIRRGVEDLTMGDSSYAQVRIAVDGKYYMKGMAIYSDDIPKGYDVVYNTNKGKNVAKQDVFKPQNVNESTGEIDYSDPFSAVLKQKVGQRFYIDKNGKERLSAVNIIKEEGDWEKHSKTIASQMLSKQDLSVAKRQLDIERQTYERQFQEIMAITNPVVKKNLLKEFASDCDSASVQLKAAAFPRQNTRVLLPLPKMKEDEVYAPGYKDGERVVLIRYPHGGKFEIPELVVNNRNRSGQQTIGNTARDAIGINPKVAEKLSGADFDGDFVLVIPNNSGKIKTAPSLEGLKNYDPKESYPAYPGMPKVTKKNFNDQQQMGVVTNLITDMQLKGAKPAEIARAVRHSMTVIDAVKHNLDWKTSYQDNGIAELKKKYQGKAQGGASTLISKAKSPEYVNERSKDYIKWDPVTGEKIYRETGRTTINSKGEIVLKQEKSYKMAERKDAHELSSGTSMETLYGDFANSMKSMANRARLAYLNTKSEKQNASATQTYAKEVESLTSKLNNAMRNAPANRKANLVASLVVKAKMEDNPALKEKDNKKERDKIRTRALAAASARYGATRKENSIDITPKEWEAIQSNAISSSKLSQILQYTNSETIKQYATPKSRPSLSTSNLAAARALLNMGYTQAEVAERFDVSVSTLIRNLDE